MSAFQPKFETIIEEVSSLCGVDAQGLPAFAHESVKMSLNLLFADWLNFPSKPNWLLNRATFQTRGGIYRYPLHIYLNDETGEYVAESTARSDSASEFGISTVESVVVYLNKDDVARIPCGNMTIDEVNSYPNVAQGRPFQYFFKQGRIPEIWFIPHPDTDYYVDFIFIKNPENIVNSLEKLDIPHRWMSLLAYGLAVKMCLKIAGAEARYQILKTEYDNAMQLVLGTEDDGTDLQIEHNIFQFGGSY